MRLIKEIADFMKNDCKNAVDYLYCKYSDYLPGLIAFLIGLGIVALTTVVFVNIPAAGNESGLLASLFVFSVAIEMFLTIWTFESYSRAKKKIKRENRELLNSIDNSDENQRRY